MVVFVGCLVLRRVEEFTGGAVPWTRIAPVYGPALKRGEVWRFFTFTFFHMQFMDLFHNFLTLLDTLDVEGTPAIVLGDGSNLKCGVGAKQNFMCYPSIGMGSYHTLCVAIISAAMGAMSYTWLNFRGVTTGSTALGFGLSGSIVALYGLYAGAELDQATTVQRSFQDWVWLRLIFVAFHIAMEFIRGLSQKDAAGLFAHTTSFVSGFAYVLYFLPPMGDGTLLPSDRPYIVPCAYDIHGEDANYATDVVPECVRLFSQAYEYTIPDAQAKALYLFAGAVAMTVANTFFSVSSSDAVLLAGSEVSAICCTRRQQSGQSPAGGSNMEGKGIVLWCNVEGVEKLPAAVAGAGALHVEVRYLDADPRGDLDRAPLVSARTRNETGGPVVQWREPLFLPVKFAKAAHIQLVLRRAEGGAALGHAALTMPQALRYGRGRDHSRKTLKLKAVGEGASGVLVHVSFKSFEVAELEEMRARLKVEIANTGLQRREVDHYLSALQRAGVDEREARANAAEIIEDTEELDGKITDLQMSMHAGFAEASAIQKKMAGAFDLRTSKIEQDKLEAQMLQVDGAGDGTADPPSLAKQMQENILGLKKSLRDISRWERPSLFLRKLSPNALLVNGRPAQAQEASELEARRRLPRAVGGSFCGRDNATPFLAFVVLLRDAAAVTAKVRYDRHVEANAAAAAKLEGNPGATRPRVLSAPTLPGCVPRRGAAPEALRGAARGPAGAEGTGGLLAEHAGWPEAVAEGIAGGTHHVEDIRKWLSAALKEDRAGAARGGARGHGARHGEAAGAAARPARPPGRGPPGRRTGVARRPRRGGPVLGRRGRHPRSRAREHRDRGGGQAPQRREGPRPRAREPGGGGGEQARADVLLHELWARPEPRRSAHLWATWAQQTRDLSLFSADSSEAPLVSASWCRHVLGLVTSEFSEMLFSTLIVLNVLIVVAEAQYQGIESGYQLGVPGSDRPAEETWPGARAVFDFCDFAFGAIFTLEIALKILALGRRYLKDRSVELLGPGHHRVLGVGEGVQLHPPVQAQDGPHVPPSAASSSVLEAQQVRSGVRVCLPHHGVHAESSLSALAWTILFFFSAELVLALVLNLVLEDPGYYLDEDKPEASRLETFALFGSSTKALLTMFEMLFGNWYGITRFLSEEISEWYIAIGLIHQLFLGFCMIEVIAGVLIHETFKVADNDNSIIINEFNRSQSAFTAKMEDLSGLPT
ncbi:unnamed protein product [Prorocentrum cordatum]|uniref:Uncharacterized protein n=1 Tax=Prorocentrum cordatum TaxID=2364126 RepID=A0ABN9S9N7_9DINO|nr:unnamed protein product [Polarella glacialis]